MPIKKQAGVEQTAKNFQCALFEAVGGHTGCDKGIIVRPNRTVMIRHRIEAGLSCCDGSDPPAVKELLAHEGLGCFHAVFLVGDLSPETVAGIRCPDSTGLLEAV